MCCGKFLVFSGSIAVVGSAGSLSGGVCIASGYSGCCCCEARTRGEEANMYAPIREGAFPNKLGAT